VVTQWGSVNSTTVTLVGGDNVVQLLLSATNVDLWWPVGLGNQPLYELSVSVSAESEVLTSKRKIGFRVFALVTDDDTDPIALKDKEGTANHTMRFKINGADVYSRGANFVPMEEFEGRADGVAIRRLLQSAADAHMNTIRIWGGGIFQYDLFYDVCDQLGIMLFHDMMYSELFNLFQPTNTTTQNDELRYQIRRLSHHPSIVIWNACNECYSFDPYTPFVMTTVAQEDRSRSI